MSTSDTDSSFGGLSNEPFAWALIPLVVFFFFGAAAIAFTIRRRRRRRLQYLQQWPGTNGQRVVGPGGNIIVVTSRRPGASRWTPWHTTRSQEGLNELGEAPPPYEGKNERREGTEMRDLEAGERPPPDYLAAPGPAVTTDSRRHG